MKRANVTGSIVFVVAVLLDAFVKELDVSAAFWLTLVIVMEEGYGKEARMLNAEEILAIVLNHPKPALSLV